MVASGLDLAFVFHADLKIGRRGSGTADMVRRLLTAGVHYTLVDEAEAIRLRLEADGPPDDPDAWSGGFAENH